jgi:orotidine-5'-phosphate decarboxylase
MRLFQQTANTLFKLNTDKLIVALDVSSLKEAQTLVERLSSEVRTFKVGKELFTAVGPDVVRMIHSKGGRVFLDLKFHDIPNTVASACKSAASLGVFMLNVHALGGSEMLRAAVKAAHEAKNPPLVLGVTVLTSLNSAGLKEVGIEKSVEQEVENLAVLSNTCGLDGVVASGHELEKIRKAVGKNFLVVTPGVRPAWAAAQDQKRIMTPKQAIEQGADFIVVGRPITQHKDPKHAAQKVLEEIQ